jgi:hypothetical protein
MGDHAQAVGAEEHRSATGLAMGCIDACGQCGGGFAAGPGFPEAAGNQHDRFDGVGFDDLVDQFVDGAGGDRDDQQVELVVQRLQAFDTFDAIDLGFTGTDDAQAFLAVAAAHKVLQDDAAEIHAGRRDPDDADRSRMNQLVDLVNGAGQAARRRDAELAMRRVYCQPVADGCGIEVQALQRKFGVRVAWRKCPGQFKHACKAGLEQCVGEAGALALGDPGKPLISQRAPEQAEKILGIREFGGGVDRGAILPEIPCLELGIESAHSGADDHAEFTGVVQADAKLDRMRWLCRFLARCVCDAEVGKQGTQFALAQGTAPCGGGLSE